MKKILTSLLAVVVLLAVMVTPVMAATTTEITGTVEYAIEVSAPAAFGMTLNPTSSPTTSPAKTVTIDANHGGWQLKVEEAGGDGYMDKSGTPLTNPLNAKGGEQTGYAALTSAVTLESGDDSTAGTGQTISDIYFQQATSWDDEAGDYTITVTFTATAGTP